MNDDLGWYRIGKTEIVGRRHPVNKHPYLVAPHDRIDDGLWIWWVILLCKFVGSRFIIKAPIDPAQFFRTDKALQGFIDDITVAEVKKIARCPDRDRCTAFDAGKNLLFQTGG